MRHISSRVRHGAQRCICFAGLDGSVLLFALMARLFQPR
jgi:hypothetical protein